MTDTVALLLAGTKTVSFSTVVGHVGGEFAGIVVHQIGHFTCHNLAALGNLARTVVSRVYVLAESEKFTTSNVAAYTPVRSGSSPSSSLALLAPAT